VKAAVRPSPAARLIFVCYVLVAIVSGLSNLASQEVVVRVLPIAPIVVSVLTGTGVGFFVKYCLEKRWVFLDGYDSHISEVRKISLYGAFGIGTTVLFWLIELSFWHIWQTMEAKYVGAAVGLSLGNWIKYLLDRHYVFPRRDCDSNIGMGSVSDR
jgi:putative flippase GtrA